MPPKAAALAAKRKLDSKAERLRQKQCWSFLLECKHSLNDGDGCPLCKLARSATREHYRLEHIKKLGKIAAGGLEKAQMRAELLEMWARSQLSSYGALKTGTPSAEISFSAAALTALAWYCEHKDEDDSVSSYFSGVRNDLKLRKRLYEVGHLAALCIQRFMRSYLCRQRVRAFMMKRFEYTFPTRHKPGYYTDKKTKDFWPEAPRLISSDGPTSPRTLVRRLNAVQRKKQDKEVQMKELMAEEIASPGKVWRDKVKTITCIRQLAILRDVIACAFKTLTKRQTRSAYSDLPVWLSLSHPAPAARQFGLNLVLENEEPLSEMSSATGAPADGEPEAAAATDKMTVNDRLQIIEALAWQQLVCESPEDVIDKLTCEEVQPALSSGHQIAEDPHQMWIGHVNFTEISALFPLEPPHQPEVEELVVKTAIVPSMEVSRAGSNEFGSFEDFDDAFLDNEFGCEQVAGTRGRAPPPDGSGLRAAQSSMESVVSPLASPRVGQDQSKWINPVFPTLVYVPPIAHAGGPAVTPTEEAVEGTDDPESAATVAMEQELRAAADLARQHYEKELVVPVQLQLRAYNESRHPAGIFRLFFYDGVLVSVTQGSAWTCYKEIVSAKDTIAASLIEYASSEQCQKVLQTMARSEEDEPAAGTVTSQGSSASGPGDLASILSGFQTSSARGNLLPPIAPERDAAASLADSQSKDVGRSECMQLYVPSDQALFGTDPIAMAPESSTTVTLTVEECKELQSQYTFLRHLATWRVAMKAAMKRGSKKKKKVDIDDTTDTAADGGNGGAEVNAARTADNTILTALAKTFGIAVPYSSDLVSADYFRLLNMDVPTAARPPMASREMFLAEYFSTHGFTADLGKGNAAVNDIVWQNEVYPLLKYEDVPTDLLTLVPPILLSSNIKHLHAPRYRVEPNASWYLSELLRIACSVNLQMERRLRSMRPVPAAGADHPQERAAEGFARAVSRAAKDLDVEPLCEYEPELNIVVLDVFLDIPRPKLKGDFGCGDEEGNDDDGTSGDQGGSSSFTMKSVFGGDKKAKKKGNSTPEPPPMIPVSLHQVIGVFPSTLPRPPPSVDMGLASWDVVLAKGETPDTADAAVRLSKKGSYGRSAGLKKKEANNWTTSRALPGVAMLNKRLPEGNNCHFRVLKTPLPQEYIEEHIPKKFRTWLGMEY